MANLKELSADSLKLVITQAESHALESIIAQAKRLREELDQVVSAAAANVPGLTELAARADIALVTEMTFHSPHSRLFSGDPSGGNISEEFQVTYGGGRGGPIGRASFKPGRYRLLLFGVCIGDEETR